MKSKTRDARLSVRLPASLKDAIEEAALLTGQSVNGFAVSTLVQAARRILSEEQVTRLSEHDRKAFAKMLDDTASRPNDALIKVAERHKKQVI